MRTASGEIRGAASLSDRTNDLVIVVPGIMGSELRDVEQGRTIWGFKDPRWYVQAWSTGRGIENLKLTDAELSGDYGRVEPVGLVRFPAFFRYFKGIDPYTRLLDRLRNWVVHDAAVLPFAYDWRLPITHNARRLADFTQRSLETWRGHDAHQRALKLRDQAPARVVFVAHSMGGLLVHHLHSEFEPMDDIRATITLGTPFFGAAKAAQILNSGRMPGVPLPAHRPLLAAWQSRTDRGVRELVANMPGVHDLLPQYRCVVDGDSARYLTPDDVETIGGNRALARASFDAAVKLRDTPLREHTAVVGVAQPTVQSMRIRDGIVEPIFRIHAGHAAGKNQFGDGTVYRESASLPYAMVQVTSVQHKALAETGQSLASIQTVLVEQAIQPGRPPLGDGGIGLSLPDFAAPAVPFTVQVNGADSARRLIGTARLLTSGTFEKRVGFVQHGDTVEAAVELERPGLYRFSVGGHGGPVIDQLILVVDPSMEPA